MALINSRFFNQLDAAANVHGTCNLVEDFLSERSPGIRVGHQQQQGTRLGYTQLVLHYNECKADQLKPDEKLQAIRDYYAFCAYGDALIGESVAAFKEYSEKRNEEYIIIYTVGDHGWHLGEQGVMAKFGSWKQPVHDAIIVSSDKQQFPAGKVVTDIVEYVDFAPTILAAADVDFDGKEKRLVLGPDLRPAQGGFGTPRPTQRPPR